LTRWPKVYYQALAPAFKPNSHFIALNPVSPNITISKPLERYQLPQSREGSTTEEKKDQGKFPHAHEIPILSFCVSCLTSKLAPHDLLVKQAQARLLALAKCGAKGNTARDGGQARDLHIAYQDKTPTKSLPG